MYPTPPAETHSEGQLVRRRKTKGAQYTCVKLFNDYYGSVYAYMQIYTYIHTYILRSG